MMLYHILLLSPFHCLVCNPNLNSILKNETLALNMQCSHPVGASEIKRILHLRHPVGHVCFRYSLRSGGALHGSDQRTDAASFQGQLRVPLCPALHGSLPAAPAGDLSREPGAAPLPGAVPKFCLQEGSFSESPQQRPGLGAQSGATPGAAPPAGVPGTRGCTWCPGRSPRRSTAWRCRAART